MSVGTSIGERIEQIRRSSGASQGSFAASLGISRTTLHNYTRDERDLPTSVLAKLLEVYRVDPLWVLDGDTGVQTRLAEVMDGLGDILAQVERRIDERGMHIGTNKRWMIVCRLYTERVAAFRQTGIQPSLEALGLDSLLDMAS